MAVERVRAEEDVDLKIPEALVELLGMSRERLSREALKLMVFELFREGKISSGKGAELLGVSRLAFLELLAERNIPFFNYSKEELQEEVEAAQEVREKLREGSV